VGGSARPAARQRVIARAGWPILVRPASSQDLLRVAEIEQASFADPWTYDALATAMGLAHIRFLVAEEGGGSGSRLVGYVVALVMGDEGEIADIAVDPSARRAGVGGALLTRIEKEMARCGVRALFLEVRESNLAALGLYRAHGFDAVGRRRGYYRKPVEDALVLRREIDPA
jgi:[ribosomal protein S18]-alanine N-acetyltransferase